LLILLILLDQLINLGNSVSIFKIERDVSFLFEKMILNNLYHFQPWKLPFTTKIWYYNKTKDYFDIR